MLAYIQIFADMEELLEPYNDEQRGRLLTAMMAYAFRGELTEFDGVERYIFPVLRRAIDQTAEKVEIKRANARGRSEAKQNEAKQSETKQSRAKQNEMPYEQEQEHEHEYEHEYEQEQEQISAAPADTNAQAAILCLRHGIKKGSALHKAIREDLSSHSFAQIDSVLETAEQADTKGGLSANFYRSILNGSGGKMMRKSKAERIAGAALARVSFDDPPAEVV